MENSTRLVGKVLSKPPILKMEHIVKTFDELVANNDITFQVEEGEIHCLFGENGAGKTTLMNILYGLLKPDKGAIYIRGQEVAIGSPPRSN